MPGMRTYGRAVVLPASGPLGRSLVAGAWQPAALPRPTAVRSDNGFAISVQGRGAGRPGGLWGVFGLLVVGGDGPNPGGRVVGAGAGRCLHAWHQNLPGLGPSTISWHATVMNL